MDLDELCASEGLDEQDLQDTVQWAKARADELVAGLVADAELGPILDAAWEDESALNRLPSAPPPLALEDALVGSADEAAAIAREVIEAALGQAQAETDMAATPSEPEEPTQPRAELRDMLAHGAKPALDLPPLPGAGHAPMKEMTQEIDADEIELLDDEDLELVDDEPPAPPSADEAGGRGVDEVPEWQQALASAHLGGGAKADHDSGLLRIPGASDSDTDEDERGAATSADPSDVDVDVSDL